MRGIHKSLICLTLMILLFSCMGKEDYTLKGQYKEPITDITQDLMVFYRSFHLANYCATDTTAARRVFNIQLKRQSLNTTITVQYKNEMSIYNPNVYDPSITSGTFEMHYKEPYLSNLTYYVTLSLNNVKNNNSTYNGKITFNKIFVNANQSYYYLYTDSLMVTSLNKTYLLKGNLALNEMFSTNSSIVNGNIELYDGMNSKLLITDYFTAENDYSNRFGLKDELSYHFLSGIAEFKSGDYSARIMVGDLPNSDGHVPSFNVTDENTRYFSEWPRY